MTTSFNQLSQIHKSGWVGSLSIIYEASKDEILLALTEINAKVIVYSNGQSSAWYDDSEFKRCKMILASKFKERY